MKLQRGFPKESGYYWHFNGHRVFEMVEISFDHAWATATTFSGRQFYETEHANDIFSERLWTPDEWEEK